MLLIEVRRGNARPVAAEGALLDRVAQLSRHRLLVVLVEQGGLAADHIAQVRTHELPDLLAADLLRIHVLAAGQSVAGRRAVVGLGLPGRGVGVGDARVLR